MVSFIFNTLNLAFKTFVQCFFSMEIKSMQYAFPGGIECVFLRIAINKCVHAKFDWLPFAVFIASIGISKWLLFVSYCISIVWFHMKMRAFQRLKSVSRAMPFHWAFSMVTSNEMAKSKWLQEHFAKFCVPINGAVGTRSAWISWTRLHAIALKFNYILWNELISLKYCHCCFWNCMLTLDNKENTHTNQHEQCHLKASSDSIPSIYTYGCKCDNTSRFHSKTSFQAIQHKHHKHNEIYKQSNRDSFVGRVH